MNIDVHIDETNDPNCCTGFVVLEAFLNDDDGNLRTFKNVVALAFARVFALFAVKSRSIKSGLQKLTRRQQASLVHSKPA